MNVGLIINMQVIGSLKDRDMSDKSVISANKYELPVISPAVNVDAKFVSE